MKTKEYYTLKELWEKNDCKPFDATGRSMMKTVDVFWFHCSEIVLLSNAELAYGYNNCKDAVAWQVNKKVWNFDRPTKILYEALTTWVIDGPLRYFPSWFDNKDVAENLPDFICWTGRKIEVDDGAE